MGELHLARSIDADLATWLALTLILGGAGAFATGRALATTWQSAWRLVPYMGALAGVDGFLCWALFDVPVISLARLAGEGWKTLVVWECDLKDEAALEARLRALMTR